MGRFDGRVALLTGAASGIGRATALLMAADGAAIAGFDRDGDGLAAVAVEVADVIRARKIPVHGMFVDRGGLDEVFRKITIDDKPGGKGNA